MFPRPPSPTRTATRCANTQIFLSPAPAKTAPHSRATPRSTSPPHYAPRSRPKPPPGTPHHNDRRADAAPSHAPQRRVPRHPPPAAPPPTRPPCNDRRRATPARRPDRKSVVSGQIVPIRVDLGGRRKL